MPLTPTTRLGPYEIIAPLGAGGMGEVYRARDTRLGRAVALKRLPEVFARDPERVARFEREAKLLASLNHPNIAVLYAVEQTDGALCLALELIEGESLAERLSRGALPMDEAFDVAIQVATALEAAHDAGVVHRDLKPGNVMLRPDGMVKVLDFGLARGPVDASPHSSGGRADLTQSPTLTSPGTMPGMILGTAAYMSPEQAKGKVATRRSDLWAWGCLLYELLSGRRAFEGEDVSETLASILRSEPEWLALPADTPPRVRELLALCLRKDMRQRLGDAGDARLLLTEARAHEPPPPTSAIARRNGLPWGVAAAALAGVALLAVGATILVLQLRSRSTPGLGSEIVRTELVPPDSITTVEGIFHYAVVSPDGRNVVFTGRRPGGRRMLWVRRLDSVTARALPGSENAIVPFWSPDGRSVAFGSDGKLRRVDLAGGQPQVLADAARLVAGSWGSADVILYYPDYRAGLHRIPATGGTPSLELPADSMASQQPRFLPDGRQYLFIKAGNPEMLAVGSLDSKRTRPLLQDITSAVYAPPGFLIYTVRGTLQARRFDAGSARFSGDPVRISTGLPNEEEFAGRVSVSRNGVLLLQRPQVHDVQLTWFDRTGRRLALVGPPRRTTTYEEFDLSPNGRRVALKRTMSSGLPDIWLVDATTGAQSRLTTDPGNDQLPVWSADGRFVYTSSQRGSGGGIYRIAVDGSDEQLLLPGPMFPHAITPDGRTLIYLHRGVATRMDVWSLPLVEGAQPIPLLTSQFEERNPVVSPDGRWLAYDSDVTGIYEVYVRSWSDGRLGEPVQVSHGGGIGARWSHDGRELFFVTAPTDAPDGTLMSVRVGGGMAALEAGAPTALFPIRVVRSLTANYEPDRNGRFLIDHIVSETTAHPTLILNWMSELKSTR